MEGRYPGCIVWIEIIERFFKCGARTLMVAVDDYSREGVACLSFTSADHAILSLWNRVRVCLPYQIRSVAVSSSSVPDKLTEALAVSGVRLEAPCFSLTANAPLVSSHKRITTRLSAIAVDLVSGLPAGSSRDCNAALAKGIATYNNEPDPRFAGLPPAAKRQAFFGLKHTGYHDLVVF
jgi:hypothetical protein